MRVIERGETSNTHITAFNMLKDAFRAIEANPLEGRYALAGNLSFLYRIKKAECGYSGWLLRRRA